MTFKELFPNVIILALDKRFNSHAAPLANHIYQRFDVMPLIFLAGKQDSISTFHHLYKHIDVPNSTFQHGPNAYNVFLCHKKMIEIAKDKQWPYVLMLEDDMFFEIQTEEVLAQLSDKIQKTPWDLLYVGFCAPEFRTDINREDAPIDLVPSGRCCGGFHCVCIRNTVYDTLLNFAPINNMDVMVETLPNRYTITPKLGEQKPGYSYVWDTIWTREQCARKLAKLHERWPNA